MGFTLAAVVALAAISSAPVRHVLAQGDRTYDRWSPIVPNITWNACNDGNGGTGFECGYLDVPMDYANSSAGKASLAITRYPSTAQPRLGTLFVNPGGPGGSGVDIVFGRGVQFNQYTGGQYDILGWDPRGVGHTFPIIDCFNSTEEEATFWQGTIPYRGIEAKGNFTNPDQTDPDAQAFWAQEPEVDKLLGDLGQLCLQRVGDALQYVGTAAVVRDILSISDVVDGPGSLIHYWGFSYGTVIGNYFVNMFPDRVGRVIIDGVVNTHYWADLPSYSAWPYKIQDTDNVFAGFTSACAQAGATGCSIATSGSTSESIRQWTLTLMDAAYDYLKKGGNFGSSYIRNMIFNAMYTPTTWSDTANNLYRIADLLYNGNNSNTRRESFDLTPPPTLWGIPRHSPRSKAFNHPMMRKRSLDKRANDERLYDYAITAITCADAEDSGNTTTKDVFNEIIFAALNSSMMFGPMWGDAGFYCHHWPARAVERYAGPWNATLKNPIIVIGNEADPITPLPGAEWVASELGPSNAYLVKQDDYGHTSLAEHSDCTIGIIDAYFSNGTLPSKDQFCGTNQPLFPNPSITKQTLDAGYTDPRFDPGASVPGLKGGSPTVNANDNGGGGSGTSPTVTVTVTPSGGAVDKKTQDEIDSLKSSKKSLEIAVGALCGAFLLALGFVLFGAFRSRQSRSYTPAGIPIVGRKGSKSRGIPVNLDDDDGHDAFLPPMKEGQTLKPSGYANDSPRASMETLKGYSDPYDPPASALGSASLHPPSSSTRGTGGGGAAVPSDGPSSPGYRYSDAGAEYHDHP